MIANKETASKYQKFLNEIINDTRKNIPTQISKKCKDDKVTTLILTYGLENGLFERVQRGLYICTKPNLFTEEQTEEFVNSLNVWRTENYPLNKDKHLKPVTITLLEACTTNQLVMELRNRGYEGTLNLVITKQVKV